MWLRGLRRSECGIPGNRIPPLKTLQHQEPDDAEGRHNLSPRAVHETGNFVQRRGCHGAGGTILRYVLSSVTRGRANAYLDWVSLGRVSEFPEGETRLATFRNPIVMPADGKTVDTACWVRRIEGEQFQVFAINCAHLGCPVRWFPQSGLFMCPCHGGAYYRDGSRASGPPERGLSNIPIK